MARSCAIRNALTNSGIRIGTSDRALRIIFPDSKSAPLACCAFMILSVSSSRVGINLSAMDIIIAISCAGRPNRSNGLSSRSIPSVRRIGVVVSVRREDPIISRTSRIAMNTAVMTPSQVTFNGPIVQITLPSTIKMFSKNVNSRIIIIGLRPRMIKLSGTLETRTQTAITPAQIANPMKLLTMNSSTIKSSVAMIFTLGSSR